MKTDFSEFSYGYAVTDELVSKFGASAAPHFPTLYSEGKTDGFDVKINLIGKRPIFLQFKLSDYLEGSNSKEYKSGLLELPYYRMHIRPTRHSQQHNLLMDLESSGYSVFYITPEFHQTDELNINYLNRLVVANSAAYSPLNIGVMPNDDSHYIVFKKGAKNKVGYRCSDESKEVKKYSLSDGFQSIPDTSRMKSQNFDVAYFHNLSENMIEILVSSQMRLGSREGYSETEAIWEIIKQFDPVGAINYMARIYFDVDLFFL